MHIERRPARGFVWPARLAHRLGKIPDRKLADLAGIHRRTVAAERKRRGIPPLHPRRPRVEWSRDMIALLGTETDREVAARLDLSVSSVVKMRLELGIPAAQPQPNHRPPGHPWKPEEIALLGRMTDAKAARRIGIHPQAARRTRRILGIPPFVPPAPPVE